MSGTSEQLGMRPMGTTHRKGRVLAAAVPPAHNKTNLLLLSINLAIQTPPVLIACAQVETDRTTVPHPSQLQMQRLHHHWCSQIECLFRCYCY